MKYTKESQIICTTIFMTNFIGLSQCLHQIQKNAKQTKTANVMQRKVLEQINKNPKEEDTTDAVERKLLRSLCGEN